MVVERERQQKQVNVRSHSRQHATNLPTEELTVCEPELQQELYDTWLKMRELLDHYAPSWYSDDLREQIETIAHRLEK